jgi:hypothetical protein
MHAEFEFEKLGMLQKMAEREVDIIYRINQELVAKHKKETAELWNEIFSLHETTNRLQAQLYDL